MTHLLSRLGRKGTMPTHATKAKAVTRAAIETLDKRQMLTISAGSAVLTVTGTSSGETLYAAWIGNASSYTLRVSDGTTTRDFVKGTFTFTRVEIYGQAGNDQLEAAKVPGITGAVFNPFLDVQLYGGDNNDTLYGSDNDDRFDGDAGDDRIYGYGGGDGIDGQAGNDTIDGMDGADYIEGGDGADSITGGNGNDTIVGESGNDLILGQAGDDDLDGGNGADTLQGGTGSDLLFSGRSDNQAFVTGGGDNFADLLSGNYYGGPDDGATDYYFPGTPVVDTIYPS